MLLNVYTKSYYSLLYTIETDMMKTFLDPGFTEVINLPDAYSPMLSEYAT
jgi:hypothetical protein